MHSPSDLYYRFSIRICSPFKLILGAVCSPLTSSVHRPNAHSHLDIGVVQAGLPHCWLLCSRKQSWSERKSASQPNDHRRSRKPRASRTVGPASLSPLCSIDQTCQRKKQKSLVESCRKEASRRRRLISPSAHDVSGYYQSIDASELKGK